MPEQLTTGASNDWRKNPFCRPWPSDWPRFAPDIDHLETALVEDRLRMVQKFSADECRRALQLLGLQTTVRKAVERRLRRLEKANATGA